MSLHDAICWLDLNGWGNVEGQSDEEEAEECRRLREVAPRPAPTILPYCAKHGSLREEVDA